MRAMAAMKIYLRRSMFLMGAGVLIVMLCIGLYLGAEQLTGNFHAVLSGQVYRSGQPTPSEIASYQKAFGIRTIVNLRGENRGRAWYDDEVAESEKLGITHVDFRMSAKAQFTQQQAESLIAILQTVEKPVRIHCEGGADRSGLAAALYLAAVAKLGEEAAESQISLLYGHVSLPIAGAYAIDRSWEGLEPWLGFHDS